MKNIKLLFVLLVLSCKSNIKGNSERMEEMSALTFDNKVIKKNEYKSNLQKKQQNKNNDEDFDKFFDKFKEDSVFQLSRIKDPVKYYTESENEQLIIDNLSKNTFVYYNYNEDTVAYKSIDHDRYRVNLEVTNDSVIYYVKGIDNGIYQYKIFKRNKNNKWYLTTIHDYSN